MKDARLIAVVCTILLMILFALGIAKNSVRHIGVGCIILCGVLLLVWLVG